MTTTDEIRQLGERWAAAEVAGDTSTLGSMITDDFRLVGPFGFVLDRQQWLDRYRSGDFSTALSWHDVEIREYGDAAVSIGTQTQEPPTKARRRMATFASATSSSARRSLAHRRGPAQLDVATRAACRVLTFSVLWVRQPQRRPRHDQDDGDRAVQADGDRRREQGDEDGDRVADDDRQDRSSLASATPTASASGDAERCARRA